jgi:outer membrane protein TolC
MKVKTGLMPGFVVFILFLALAWVSLPAEENSSSAVRTLTLEECISIALEHNADAVIALKSMKLAKAEVLGAMANFIPHLSSTSSYSRDLSTGVLSPHLYRTSLNLSQSLFNGGYNLAYLSHARAGKQGAEDSYESTLQLIALDVKIRYFNLLKNDRLLRVAEELVRSSEERVKREESLYEIGATAKANLLRAKVKLGEDRLYLISGRNDLSLARADLNDILGWHLDTLVQVVDNLTVERVSFNLPALTEQAVSRHPSVRMARTQVQQAKASLGMAKSGRLPSLSAKGGYSWSDIDLPEDMTDWKDHDSWGVELSLSVPIFDGFATKSNIRQAKLNLAIAEENLKQAKREVILAVKRAFLSVTEAEERIQVAEERYRLGASFMLELIDSQVAFSTAQLNHISALYDYNLAVAQLEQAVGRPVIHDTNQS